MNRPLISPSLLSANFANLQADIEQINRSDAGAEMAATYHSVIGTVKLHGSSIWNFIGTFFKNIFNGCRDYVNMVPDKITLATSQC